MLSYPIANELKEASHFFKAVGFFEYAKYIKILKEACVNETEILFRCSFCLILSKTVWYLTDFE